MALIRIVPFLVDTDQSQAVEIASALVANQGLSAIGHIQLQGVVCNTGRTPAGTLAPAGYDAQGNLTHSTDALICKEEVAPCDSGLDVVANLQPVKFKYQNESRYHVGLLAEQLHALGLSEAVLYDAQGNPDSVLYTNIVALLVKAVQELRVQNEELKTQSGALKTQINTLENNVTALLADTDKLKTQTDILKKQIIASHTELLTKLAGIVPAFSVPEDITLSVS